jgi:phosphohistidine phosphatase SixA
MAWRPGVGITQGMGIALALSAAMAFAQPTHVFVVRHAERAATPKDDPALSPEGVARAEQLAQILAAAGVGTVITTPYLRTQATAAPTAKRAGVTPIVITKPGKDMAAHVAEVVAEVRKASGVVLVVAHSNTVAPIVAALSGSTPRPLCETSFGHLFIATPVVPSLPAVQLKYGAQDRAPAAGCQ